MSEKIQVPVDLQDLCIAFEMSSIDDNYYLDLITGEIFCINDYSDENEEFDEIVIEGTGKCYASIPNTDLYAGYENMENFIETVKDSKFKKKLRIAINGKGAFKQFKDVLLTFLKERERWFKFKDTRTLEKINDWLEEEGIEIIMVGTADERE